MSILLHIACLMVNVSNAIEKEQEILAKHYHRRYTDRQQPEQQDEVTYVIYRIKR